MHDDMFSVVRRPTGSVGRGGWLTLPLSVVAHAAVMLAVLIVPLLTAEALKPPPEVIAFLSAAAVPVVPPPPAPPKERPMAWRDPGASVAAPVEAPAAIAPERGVSRRRGGDAADSQDAPIGAVSGFVGTPEPELLPQVPVPHREVVRVGGHISPPAKVKDVKPSYPSIAQAARVQGIVIIEATIGPSGRVEDTRVLRSIPLLDAAALEAVRQWEYTPTLLNNQPVPVIMTVTVNFTLQ